MSNLTLNDFRQGEFKPDDFTKLVESAEVVDYLSPTNALSREVRGYLECFVDMRDIEEEMRRELENSESMSSTIEDLPFGGLNEKASEILALGFTNMLGSVHPSSYSYDDYRSSATQVDKHDRPELVESVVHEAGSQVKNAAKPAIIHSDDSFRSMVPDLVSLAAKEVKGTGGESLIWLNSEVLAAVSDSVKEVLSENFPFAQGSNNGPIVCRFPVLNDGTLRYRPDRLVDDLLNEEQKRALESLAKAIEGADPIELKALCTGDVRVMSNKSTLHSRKPYEGTRSLIKTRLYS